MNHKRKTKRKPQTCYLFGEDWELRKVCRKTQKQKAIRASEKGESSKQYPKRFNHRGCVLVRNRWDHGDWSLENVLFGEKESK